MALQNFQFSLAYRTYLLVPSSSRCGAQDLALLCSSAQCSARVLPATRQSRKVPTHRARKKKFSKSWVDSGAEFFVGLMGMMVGDGGWRKLGRWDGHVRREIKRVP